MEGWRARAVFRRSMLGALYLVEDFDWVVPCVDAWTHQVAKLQKNIPHRIATPIMFVHEGGEGGGGGRWMRREGGRRRGEGGEG